MIIVTDAHVSESYGNVEPFFAMLEKLAETNEDIVFLGDIFELWIGLKRYESAIHRDFTHWCKAQKKRRSIGFVEGNHEFFVRQRHNDCFTWASEKRYLSKKNKTLFVHGDLINRADKNYLRFRRLTKNVITKNLVRVMPRGPLLAERLKAKLKTTNQDFRLGLPKEALRSFAEVQFSQSVSQIIVGHFHESFRYSNDSGQMLQVLPDWHSHQTIGILESGDLRVIPWEKWSP